MLQVYSDNRAYNDSTFTSLDLKQMAVDNRQKPVVDRLESLEA